MIRRHLWQPCVSQRLQGGPCSATYTLSHLEPCPSSTPSAHSSGAFCICSCHSAITLPSTCASSAGREKTNAQVEEAGPTSRGVNRKLHSTKSLPKSSCQRKPMGEMSPIHPSRTAVPVANHRAGTRRAGLAVPKLHTTRPCKAPDHCHTRTQDRLRLAVLC